MEDLKKAVKKAELLLKEIEKLNAAAAQAKEDADALKTSAQEEAKKVKDESKKVKDLAKDIEKAGGELEILNKNKEVLASIEEKEKALKLERIKFDNAAKEKGEALAARSQELKLYSEQLDVKNKNLVKDIAEVKERKKKLEDEVLRKLAGRV